MFWNIDAWSEVDILFLGIIADIACCQHATDDEAVL